MQDDLFNLISLNALFSQTSCIVTVSPSAGISEKEWTWVMIVQIGCLLPHLTALQISLPSMWWQSERACGWNESQNTSDGSERESRGEVSASQMEFCDPTSNILILASYDCLILVLCYIAFRCISELSMIWIWLELASLSTGLMMLEELILMFFFFHSVFTEIFDSPFKSKYCLTVNITQTLFWH
jgi:hypothetical protein